MLARQCTEAGLIDAAPLRPKWSFAAKIARRRVAQCCRLGGGG
jgi:hypothetical protein